MAFILKRDNSIGQLYGFRFSEGRLSFPMVDINSRMSEILWTQGLIYKGSNKVPSMKVGKSIGVSTFKLNHEGAYAKQAVYMPMMLGGSRKPTPRWEINSPFVLWISRLGTNIPVFAAQIGYSDWKSPGSLPRSHSLSK